ncbi:MAG TPA: AbrB family transcriptional regulator [Thermoanaerobaculia bacterium]|nr:AbrB family transcriptional regulator [Thermoanaerobaculia bacterium]
MAHVVGEKGQVVIEKPLRETLGIQPGFVAVQSVVGDHLEIRFYPPEHRRSLRGRLEGFAKRSISEKEWAHAREEAWATEAGEGADR